MKGKSQQRTKTIDEALQAAAENCLSLSDLLEREILKIDNFIKRFDLESEGKGSETII